ncbi:hypothetical protein SUGI_0901910 [Cryptomeria japonica]|nr:hypothetical protein SUGI_0901910 [Cryptomeria japonica]
MAKVCRDSVKHGSLCFLMICIILLQSVVIARELHEGGAIKASTLSGKEEIEFSSTVKEEESMTLTECENNEDEEESMDRRTLAAHTDYIYTKHNNSPP